MKVIMTGSAADGPEWQPHIRNKEKHGIACDMLHGFDWSAWTTGNPSERLALIPAGQEHIRRGERQRRSISQPSGCEERATLGSGAAMDLNPEGVAAICRHAMDSTPLGLEIHFLRNPRAGVSSPVRLGPPTLG